MYLGHGEHGEKSKRRTFNTDRNTNGPHKLINSTSQKRYILVDHFPTHHCVNILRYCELLLLSSLIWPNKMFYLCDSGILPPTFADTCHCRWIAQRTARGCRRLSTSRWRTWSGHARGWYRRSSGKCMPTSPASHTSSAIHSPRSSATWSAPRTRATRWDSNWNRIGYTSRRIAMFITITANCPHVQCSYHRSLWRNTTQVCLQAEGFCICV